MEAATPSEAPGIRWEDERVELRCLVCEADGPKRRVATADDWYGRSIGVVRCPACESFTLDGPCDGHLVGDQGTVDAYVEHVGAIEVIAAALAQVEPGTVRRFLDVGCGYGFALDFARFAWGWECVGVDPSPVARRGGTDLGVDIRPETLDGDPDLGGPFDLVLASEVVEHVTQPVVLLSALAKRMHPRATLILTTPAADAVHPGAPAQACAALSPGNHAFVASRQGLERLLRRAGFGSVAVSRDGATLRAAAALPAGEQTRLRTRGEPDRLQLETYYDARAEAQPPESALANGMAVRHFKAVVNRGDFKTAKKSFARLGRALAARHTIDLDDPRATLAIVESRAVLPLHLTGASYAAAMYELLGRARPDRAVAHFDVAAATAEKVRCQPGGADAETPHLRLMALAHRVLALARSAPDRVGEALARLDTALAAGADDVPAQLAAGTRARTFVELVVAGRYDVATPLVPSVTASVADLASSTNEARRRDGLDAAFSLGMLDLQSDRPAAAERWFGRTVVLAERGHGAESEHSVSLAATARRHEALARERRPTGPKVVYGLDAYWCDPSGVFLAGWAHAGAEPVRAITVQCGDRTARQDEPLDRPELLEAWPEHPHVRRSGFELLVPGQPEPVVRLGVETAAGTGFLEITLPDHPLPAWPKEIEELGALGARLWERLAEIAPPGPILEIGPRRPHGEAAREAPGPLRDRRFIGVDIHSGSGVDVVGDAHRLASFVRPGTVAAVVSASVLEHLQAPWLVAAEIAKLLPIGGCVLQVAPAAWPAHAEPNDFWRFSPDGLQELFGPQLGFEIIEAGGGGFVSIVPSPPMRLQHARMPTLPSVSMSYVLARKIRDVGDGLVRWPRADAAGERRARSYPEDGLALARDLVPGQRVSAPGADRSIPSRPSSAGERSSRPAPAAPAVSVVLPLYNGRRYVRAAVDSVLAQTNAPCELVVIDDGSTDGSADELAGVGAPFPIRVTRQSNAGQSAARNQGVRVARGEIIAFLDQDDLWEPRHLEALVAPLADPRVGWVYSDFDEIDDAGRIVTVRFMRDRNIRHPKRSLGACLAEDLMVVPSASVLRRSAFDAVGGFDEILSGYEDDDLFVRMFRAGWRHVFVRESLTRFRVHAVSSSTQERFLRSRIRYAEKLGSSVEDDVRLGRYYLRDLVAPRFFRTCLDDYVRSVSARRWDEARQSRDALERFAALGEPSLGLRAKLALIHEPHVFRALLRLQELVPAALRPVDPTLRLRRSAPR